MTSTPWSTDLGRVGRLAFAFLAAMVAACSEPPPPSTAHATPPPPVVPSRDPATFIVCLQPLGKHDATLLAPIASGIGQAYGFDVRTLIARPLPPSAWYEPRQRYRAENLMYHLFTEVLPAAPDCAALIGFTAVDISITKGEAPDWGVFGLAYRGNRVGVVSSFRLRRDVEHHRVVERAVKVTHHELGHVLGLEHRSDGAACLMNDAGGRVQTIDAARGTLCDDERARVVARLNLDIAARAHLDWDDIHERSSVR